MATTTHKRSAAKKTVTILAKGSRGAEVVKLQTRLKAAGFNPGSFDGDFGPATQAAVIAFQKSQGLLADGVVGPRTLTALGLAKIESLPSALGHVTPTHVSKMFPFTPVNNIKHNLPFVLKGLEGESLIEKPMALMALATIRAETESFEPISEFRSQFNTSPGGHPFDLYDSRADLGHRGPPDGERYRGRGYIQLTGKFNYNKYGRALGMGDKLVANPELANDPTIAGKLLARFLKDVERPVKEALLIGDLRTARRLVNGGSHGLERFTEAYQIGTILIP